MSRHDTEGFRRFKQQRAEKAATSTDEDRAYEMFTDAMTGTEAERMAGVASTGTPGGREVPDDLDEAEVYRGYLDVLSGAAGRRKAEETARLEKIEREQEIVRHVREVGGGMSSSFEHLRDRIPGAGKPGEGA